MVMRKVSSVRSFAPRSAKDVKLEDMVKKLVFPTCRCVCLARKVATVMSLDVMTQKIVKNVAWVSTIQKLARSQRIFVCLAELVDMRMKQVVFQPS